MYNIYFAMMTSFLCFSQSVFPTGVNNQSNGSCISCEKVTSLVISHVKFSKNYYLKFLLKKLPTSIYCTRPLENLHVQPLKVSRKYKFKLIDEPSQTIQKTTISKWFDVIGSQFLLIKDYLTSICVSCSPTKKLRYHSSSKSIENYFMLILSSAVERNIRNNICTKPRTVRYNIEDQVIPFITTSLKILLPLSHTDIQVIDLERFNITRENITHKNYEKWYFHFLNSLQLACIAFDEQTVYERITQKDIAVTFENWYNSLMRSMQLVCTSSAQVIVMQPSETAPPANQSLSIFLYETWYYTFSSSLRLECVHHLKFRSTNMTELTLKTNSTKQNVNDSEIIDEDIGFLLWRQKFSSLLRLTCIIKKLSLPKSLILYKHWWRRFMLSLRLVSKSHDNLKHLADFIDKDVEFMQWWQKLNSNLRMTCMIKKISLSKISMDYEIWWRYFMLSLRLVSKSHSEWQGVGTSHGLNNYYYYFYLNCFRLITPSRKITNKLEKETPESSHITSTSQNVENETMTDHSLLLESHFPKREVELPFKDYSIFLWSFGKSKVLLFIRRERGGEVADNMLFMLIIASIFLWVVKRWWISFLGASSKLPNIVEEVIDRNGFYDPCSGIEDIGIQKNWNTSINNNTTNSLPVNDKNDRNELAKMINEVSEIQSMTQALLNDNIDGHKFVNNITGMTKGNVMANRIAQCNGKLCKTPAAVLAARRKLELELIVAVVEIGSYSKSLQKY